MWQNVHTHMFRLLSCLISHSLTVKSSVSDVYLTLHQHGHIHEHIVQLTDAVLQFDDFIVPRLNLIHSLFTDVAVHDDLEQTWEGKNDFQNNSALITGWFNKSKNNNKQPSPACSEKVSGWKLLSHEIQIFTATKACVSTPSHHSHQFSKLFFP